MNITEDYIIPTKYAAALSKGLEEIWIKLGKPTDMSTSQGWVVMDNIVQVWMKAFPYELEDFIHDRNIDLQTERTVREHVEGGVYNPVTYPGGLYSLIKAMFPDVNIAHRKFFKEFTSRYPLFKTTNLRI